MTIHSIHDGAFRTYGQALDRFQLDAACRAALEVPKPETGIAYLPSVEALEQEPAIRAAAQELFGEAAVQIGVCNGYNREMSTVEYHKSSEVNIACTPLLLFFGHIWDLEDNRYDLSSLELFRAEAGDVFEVYGTTLHFAPCQAEDGGFCSIVILPKGTGEILPAPCPDQTLAKINKWLITHPDNAAMRARGVPAMLTGSIRKV